MAFVEIKWQVPINKKNCIRVGEYWYNRDEKSIAIDHPFPVPMRLKVIDLYYVEVTPAFLSVPNLIRANIDFNLLCLLLDSIYLLQKEKVLLHGSCYERNEKGVLNVGFQNTGKTYNTLKAVKDGAYLISEEYTVIDKDGRASSLRQFVSSCVSWNTIRDCELYLTPKEAMVLFFRIARAKLMPFMFEGAISKKRKVSGISSPVHEIRVSNKPLRRGAIPLILFTENEYNFFASQLLVSYAYASGFDLITLNTLRRNLIRRFVENVDAKTDKVG